MQNRKDRDAGERVARGGVSAQADLLPWVDDRAKPDTMLVVSPRVRFSMGRQSRGVTLLASDQGVMAVCAFSIRLARVDVPERLLELRECSGIELRLDISLD